MALLLLAVPSWSSAEDPGSSLRLDPKAAWSGVARSGAWTELHVGVVSEYGGELVLEARAAEVTSRLSGRVEALVPASFRLPAWVDRSGSIEVRAYGPEAVVERAEILVRRTGLERRVIATASQQFIESAEGSIVVAVEPSTLPSFGRAYEWIDLLVLDAPVLTQLALPQVRALAEHLGACGRAILLGLSEVDQARWREVAGCGGEFLRMEESEDSIRELLSDGPVEPSRAGFLPPPSSPRHPAQRPLEIFFLLYVLALVAGLFSVRTVGGLAAIPMAASAILVAGLWLSPPRAYFLAQVEAVEGAEVARFSMLLRIDGFAPGLARVEIPRFLGLPDPSADASLEIHLKADEATTLVAEVPTYLLSRRFLSLAGAMPWRAPVEFELDGADVRVTNAGSTPLAAGYLVLGERVVALPELEPGEVFAAHDVHPVPSDALASLPPSLLATPRTPSVLLAEVPPPLQIPGAEPGERWTSISARVGP